MLLPISKIHLMLFLAILSHQMYIIESQLTIEALNCAKFKRDVYEQTFSFNALVIDAPIITQTVDKCNQKYIPLIVDGEPANSKEFPFMARIGRIESNGLISWFCGGTLLNEKYVLTAAHCFYTAYGTINRVRLGEVNLDEQIGTPRMHQDFGIRRYIYFPTYKSELVYDDIGLIELDNTVKFDEFKHPACLPTSSGDEYQVLQAIGWGSAKFIGPSSQTLMKVKLNRFPYERCAGIAANIANDVLPNGIDDASQICAGSEMRKDTCTGDSGGPLLGFHKNYKCMYTIVGITSYGISGCGTPKVPAIYTRVYRYLDWIRNIVWP